MPKLRVLVTNSKSGAFFYICNGLINALNAAGHDAKFWDNNVNSWKNFDPDIYIGCSGWKQNIPPEHVRGKTKIAIHVNPFCPTIIKSNGPVINEPKANIDWVIQQRPNAVFGYGSQDDMNKYWHLWKFKLIGMPNAADATKYYRVKKDPKHSVDVGWVGGYWPYKAVNMDQYLLPVVKRFKTTWYGWSGPKNIWSGKVSDEETVRKLFSSAKICPTIVEPHTTLYGIDIPERIFKVSACGALVISDPVAGLRKYFSNDSLIMANNPTEYLSLCTKWINASEEERRIQANKLRSEVMSKHTYYNRVQILLKNLGFVEEAKEFDMIIKSLV